MAYRFFPELFLAFAVGSSLLISSCGKKSETTQGESEISTQPITDIDRYMEKQDVNCENNGACPNYIAKIVIVNNGSFNTCTGILLDNGLVATSTSCLPRDLSDIDCNKNVFFFFPGNKVGNPERARCSKVVQTSDIDGNDPVLWRDDVAYLQLVASPKRTKAKIARDGIKNKTSYTAWMIDQQDDFSAVIRKQTCEGVQSSYVNPLASRDTSPNMLFGGCVFTKGGSGAPVIDSKGKVRGIISQDILPEIKKYILSTGLIQGELQSILYGTNFSCAPTPFDTTNSDDAECRKDINSSEVNNSRGKMLSIEAVFGEINRKYEDSLDSLSQYIRFEVNLISQNGDVQTAEIVPKCFKHFSDWVNSLKNVKNAYINEVNIPTRTYKRAMDSYGRVLGLVDDGPKVHTSIQFFMKSVRRDKSSTIIIWTNGTDTHALKDPLTECSSLL